MSQLHGEDREPVEVLAAEFLEQQRRGGNPTIADYVAKHPELAHEIRELFPAIIALERLKSQGDAPHRSRASLGATKLDRLGEFRLLSEIGRGGMGVVYEALHESLGRHVAVKVLPKQSTRQCRAFQREARTVARLHHTNIVPLFGVGEHDGYHYIVMQLIRGVDLEAVLSALRSFGSATGTTDSDSKSVLPDFSVRNSNDSVRLARALVAASCRPGSESMSVFGLSSDELLSSKSPSSNDNIDGDTTPSLASPQPNKVALRLPALKGLSGTRPEVAQSDVLGAAQFGPPYWRRVAAIGRQCADALHYAHLHRTLHRDIKPANLVLDAQGVVWITDFGLAKAMDESHGSHSGTLAGTLRYMAPEQFAGQCDHRSDIYGLGLTLYELLTLQPAFSDSSRSSLIRKITQERPIPIRQLCPRVPRDLEAIVTKAIAREPDDRYQSAGDFAGDLQRFLEDCPVSARPMSAVERMWRWARRNRAVAAMSTTAAVFLLTTAIFATAQYVQRTRAWETESKLRSQADAERLRVEANLRLAAQAFDDVFGRVTGVPPSATLDSGSEEEFPTGSSSVPVVNEREAAILKGLLSFYDQFAKQNENDLRWQRETARAFRRAGEIQCRLGNLQEGTISYSQALMIFERLLANDPTNADYIAKIALTHNRLANIAWETGRGDVALSLSKTAWEELLRNPAILATSAPCRIELARAYNQYAIASPPFHFSMRPGPQFANRRVDPREYLQRAIGISETLLSDNPGSLEYCMTLAESYRYLWWTESHRKQFDTAQRAREQAIQLVDDLAKAYPDEPECRFRLAELYLLPFRFGLINVKPNEASDQITRALDLATNLTNQFPQVPKYQIVLAQSLWSASRVATESGQTAESNDYLDKAITVQKAVVQNSPTRGRSVSDLIRFLEERVRRIRSNGEPAALQAAVEDLIATVENLPESMRSSTSFARTNAKAYADLADLLKAQGQIEKAQSAEAKAKEYSTEANRRSPRPFSRSQQVPFGSTK